MKELNSKEFDEYFDSFMDNTLDKCGDFLINIFGDWITNIKNYIGIGLVIFLCFAFFKNLIFD
jgi:hypothetical protein